jgi:gas vesicle protein
MANEQTRGMTDFATGETDGASGIRERAREVVDQAKGKATESLETKFSRSKTRAAETLSGVAQTLRSSTQQLRDQNQEGASRAIERAADGVERFATYLQDADVDQVIDSVHEFARRQPAAFIGGAFALGFLASRFLKASTPDNRRYLYGSSDQGYGTTRYESSYNTTRTYEGGIGNTGGLSGERGFSRDGGFGNTGDISGSQGYGAGLSTTGGGTTGGGYTTGGTYSAGGRASESDNELGDGSPGVRSRERTGGNDVGSD